MGVQQDAQSYAERAHLYSSRIGTVWWFVNFFFRVLIVGGMAKDFLGNELIIQSLRHTVCRFNHDLVHTGYLSVIKTKSKRFTSRV